MTTNAPPRALCSRCLKTVDAAELRESDGERLCAACRTLDARADERPRAAIAAGVPSTLDLEPGLVRGFFAAASAWTRGRHAIFRIPLLLFLAYVFVRHLANPMYQSILKPLNLGIHELGHYVFGPFGDFLAAAGGSILQCLVPVIGIAMFYRQRDYFAIAVGFGWLATNFYDVAVYIGDARAQALQLVTPGGGHAIHDWHYLLGRMELLAWDRTFESILRVVAAITMLAALGFGGWLTERMIRRRRERASW